MALGFLPAAMVVDMSVPSIEGVPVGIGEALGCSGGPSGPEVTADYWGAIGPARFAEDEPIHSATDGFFVISAQGANLSIETAKAQLRVAVRDGGGADVPGDVSVLADRSDGAASSFLFGWTARERLALGAELTVTLGLDPSVPYAATRGGQFALLVEGEPTPLPLPEARFDWWHTHYHSEGLANAETPSCLVKPACQAPYTLTVPPRVVERLATSLLWTAPENVAEVAWAVRVELRPEHGEVETPTGEQIFLGSLDGPLTLSAGNAIFRDRAESYCVDVVLEDLRTGLEQRTQLCSAPGPLMQASADRDLNRCSTPPSDPELARAWCEVQGPGNQLEACAPHREGQPVPPSGVPTLPPDAGSAQAEDAKPDSDRALPGCAIGAPRRNGPFFPLSLAGLASVALLRRRHRR